MKLLWLHSNFLIKFIMLYLNKLQGFSRTKALQNNKVLPTFALRSRRKSGFVFARINLPARQAGLISKRFFAIIRVSLPKHYRFNLNKPDISGCHFLAETVAGQIIRKAGIMLFK
ncbi:hypothetical protein EZ428_01885 [Pedobacter frigiditerrae]|uniref:Uncharacterized protein n=1 Tax=Pedobacter frigiditerrae TaxID=2530452 RepID=A0A4R0N1I9_9SPHI|nr:hypothetical protein EZ428_01885 [Pedobacter frigiditerrae]